MSYNYIMIEQKGNIEITQNDIQKQSINLDINKNKMVVQPIKQKNSHKTEYKIIPVDSNKLCLLDPILLFWIISIIGILLYIIGHKIKSNSN